MIKKASVSVVIPCYNAEKTIIRALDSVVSQSLFPHEVIVVDDKSIDKSCELIKNYIKRYEDQIKITLIELEENSGPAKARNVGWDAAVSEYIAFLDADDSWHLQKIELQYNYMFEHPEVVLSAHLYEVVDANNVLIESKKIDEIEKITKNKLLIRNRFSTPTVMLKREITLRFRESKRYSEDYLLWLEILFNNYQATVFNVSLSYLYKPVYGVSGLSANIVGMWKGGLENYKILKDKKHINYLLYTLLVLLRTVKFLRMYILSKILYGPRQDERK